VGGSVVFRHQVSWDPAGHFVVDPRVEPNGPTWLRKAVGDEYFQTVDQVNLIDTDVTDEWLQNLRMVPHIRLLYLRGTNVTGNGLRHIGGLKNLEVLDLQERPGLTAEVLANLATLRKLTSVDMTGCAAVGDDGLAEISDLTQLRTLSLSGSQVTDQGLRHLKDMSQTSHLWLGDTNVTDEGLKQLSHMKRMYWLDLRGTRVTDEGLKHLTSMNNLWQLVFWDTQVTEAGVKRIRSALPNLDLVAIGVRPSKD